MKRFISIYGYSHDANKSITTIHGDGTITNRHIEFERVYRQKRMKYKEIESPKMLMHEDQDDLIVFPVAGIRQLQYFFDSENEMDYFTPFINWSFDDSKIIKHPITGHDVMLVSHHIAHAAYAYYSRPLWMKDTDVFVYDGRGIDTDSLLLHNTTRISPIDNIGIGSLWDDCSRLIYGNIHQEGKLMGWSAYGEYNHELEKYFQGFVANFIKYNKCFGGNGFPNSQEEKHNEIREFLKLAEKKYKPEDVGHTVQKFSEIYITEYLKKFKQSDNLCISGGVGLNGYINQRLIEGGIYKNVYIPPAVSDAGITQGANMFAVNKFIEWRPQEVRYIGNEYPYHDDSAKKMDYPDLYKYIAQKLREKKIVGWYQGRSESGPRALGNRSILCDPTFPDMKDYINERVKHREWYRPFAPAILQEYTEDWFMNIKEELNMLKICKFKPGMGEKVPSVCHADGTGRLQTITPESNQHFYNLISEFHKLSGVPILLNTSFNDNGEPIVETPQDALNTFNKTNIDILVIHNYIYEK